MLLRVDEARCLPATRPLAKPPRSGSASAPPLPLLAGRIVTGLAEGPCRRRCLWRAHLNRADNAAQKLPGDRCLAGVVRARFCSVPEPTARLVLGLRQARRSRASEVRRRPAPVRQHTPTSKDAGRENRDERDLSGRSNYGIRTAMHVMSSDWGAPSAKSVTRSMRCSTILRAG